MVVRTIVRVVVVGTGEVEVIVRVTLPAVRVTVDNLLFVVVYKTDILIVLVGDRTDVTVRVTAGGGDNVLVVRDVIVRPGSVIVVDDTIVLVLR